MIPPASQPQNNDAAFQALLQKYNYTPPSSKPATGGWYDKLNPAKPAAQAPAPTLLQETAANYGGQINAAKDKIVSSVTDAAKTMQDNAPDGVSKGGQIINEVKAAGEGGLGAAAGGVQAIFAPIAAPIQTLLGHVASSNAANPSPTANTVNSPEADAARQQITDWAQAHPELARTLGDAFTVGTAVIGSNAADNVLNKPVSEIATNAKTAAIDATNNVHDKISNLLDSATPVEAATQAKSDGSLVDSLRTKVATGKMPLMGEANVSKQAQTSAERLTQKAVPKGVGGAIRPKPIDMYNDFVKQETKHMGDIKEDPAISMVGERIGNAYNDVIKMRQNVGKDMAAELQKTAKVPVDTGSAFGNFQKELIDNGASYDSVNKTLSSGAESKFSEADKGILEKYASDLQTLGNKPTMKAVDAFVSRIPQDIKALKASKGITFKTNAERLISNNLNDLRDALGNTGSPEYKAARTAYSKLSNFLDEGVGLLGKKTQSGDYARDASIAKSSVQSVLNNGKKDWLIKLEGLTGYPALDESTLALQAMKDSGDFKGNSLLDLLTENGKTVPASPSGIVGKIIGMGYDKGKEMLAGSKVEQTRAFLKSIDENK